MFISNSETITAQMETAFYRAYGISYQEYSGSFEQQMRVEKQREREHKQMAHFVADLRQQVQYYTK